jgi:hypothetical protein
MADAATRDSSSELDVVVSTGEPAQLRVTGILDRESLRSWLADQREALHTRLRRHGHLLIRGLPMRAPEDLALARDILVDDPELHPREETTPRSAYGNGVFTATDLPPEQTIRLHNEDSYSVAFPGTLLFCCLQEPQTGGATTLGDVRQVLQDLPAELVDRFRDRGWLITRTFTEHIGLSWQRAFGTDDPAELAEFCAAAQVGHEWLPGGRLRTTGLRAATIRHPRTGEETWFNHVAVFNEWTHDDQTRQILVAAFGPDGLPQNTYYGDGSPIDLADIAVLNAAYDRATIPVHWQTGDLLLVDNILCSHGRQPYSGTRRVAVALGDPVDATTCSPSGPIGPHPHPRQEVS